MFSGGERRRSERRAYAHGHLPPAARIRPGTPVIVVNMSMCGALVEANLRCKPGGRCEFVMVGQDGELVVRARVVRCFVARVTAAAVRYRTALAFEQHVALPAASMETGYELPIGNGHSAGPREASSRSGAG